jgi:hypothetical protein
MTSLQRLLVPLMVVLATAPIASGQKREVEVCQLPSQPPSTTPGTYRDPVSDGIERAQEEVERMATTKIEKFSRWNRAGFTRRARQVQFRQQTSLVERAGKLASSGYLKTLGWVNTLSDSVATVGGHLAQKDLRGAAVAAVDEGAQSLAAAGGAWALGKLGAGVGLTFGGPPGMMVGGAVCGVVGAVAATVGYNAYASDAVTSAAEGVIEPPEPENYYREEARKNRIEWLVANGYPIPAILLEQDWAERDRQIRTPDAAPPPVFVVGPPAEENKPAAPPVKVVDVRSAQRFCFTESNMPEGWRLSRTRPSLKQFTPTYRPEYDDIFQYFNLYPAAVREKVHQDGSSAHHYDADGKYVPSERHRWVSVHMHIGPAEYVIKESGYRVVWRDWLAEQVKRDGSWRSDLKLIRQVNDNGIEVGYLVQEESRGERKNHYQCVFIKGDWRVDISVYGHYNFVEQEQETILQVVRLVAARIPSTRN